MEKKQLADGNPLQFLEDLSSLDFNELAQQIYSLLEWFADTVSSVIEKINKLDIDESELKQKRRECVENLETARTSAGTFIESAKNFFIYADLDQDQEATIKEYYRTGNYEGIKSHINKVQVLLEQTHECYEEFLKKFEAAKASCDGIVGKSDAKKTAAKNKKIAARVIGSSAAVAGAGAVGAAGVGAVGVGASLVAGVFTFGIGTIVGLAITGAAVGTVGVATAGAASATTYLVSRNFEKLEKTFRDLSSEFEKVTKDVSDLGSIIDKVLQKLKATGKNLDMLMKNHITANQGDDEEFDHKQFTKAFEMLLEGIRKGRLLASEQLASSSKPKVP